MSAQYFITIEEIERAQKLARELREQYGTGIPWHLLVLVPNEEVDKVVAGISADYLNLTGAKEFIARPRGYKIYSDGIVWKYQNRVKAYMQLPNNPEERREVFTSALKGVHLVRRAGSRWIVAKVLEAHTDVEGARKVIEEHGWQKALGYMVGYNTKGVINYWWRFLALIRGVHYAELSPPGTGKTTFALALQRHINVVYSNEAPSMAYLVADARDNSVGAVANADVLVIDEIDKIDFSDTFAYQALLSGMENGVWVRSKGKGFEVVNPVSVVFSGNCGMVRKVEIPCRQLTRGEAESILSKVLKTNAKPLVDRLALIAVMAPRFNKEYTDNVILRPPVARGIYRLLNEGFQPEPITGDPRIDKQISAIKYIVRLTAGIELSNEEAQEVWKGAPLEEVVKPSG